MLTDINKFQTKVAHLKEAYCPGWRWKMCPCTGCYSHVGSCYVSSPPRERAECAVPVILTAFLCPNPIVACA